MSALADIQRLVECESPTEDLDACNQVIDLAVEISNTRLKPIAQKVIENGRPVFWWGAKNPKIVLLCHLDTVWPIGSFLPTWKVNGDQVSGPGIFDMKTGFIQAMHALVGIENAEAKVALVPFRAFGASDDSTWFRLSVGTTSMDDVKASLNAIESALKGLQKP